MKAAHLITLTLAVALLIVAGSTASAQSDNQSDNEIRQENQRLKRENEELKRELEAARARIEALEREVETLREAMRQHGVSEGGRRTTPTEPEPEKVSIDESEPLASPRALLKALKENYAEAMEELEMGAPGDRERTIYLRNVERWRGRANAEYRGRIQWHVLVEDVASAREGYLFKLRAVDPKFDTKLGDPFEVFLPRNKARRLEQSPELAEGKLVLRGSLRPDIRLNPEREASGVFDNPKLIGPFAEYVYLIDVTNLLPASDVDVPQDDESNDQGDDARGDG